MSTRGWLRHARLGAFVAVAAAMVTGLAASPAHANGITQKAIVFEATSAGGTVMRCTAVARAEWSADPVFGDFSLTSTGITTCGRVVPMSGTIDIIPSGDTVPVSSRSFSFPGGATQGTAGDVIAVNPGESYYERYQTTVSLSLLPGFTWTSYPSTCAPVPSTRRIVCDFTTGDFTIA